MKQKAESSRRRRKVQKSIALNFYYVKCSEPYSKPFLKQQKEEETESEEEKFFLSISTTHI